jgi:DNA repair photolyase
MKDFKAVSVKRVKKIFTDPDSSEFGEYIKNRFPFQWGGLSEPFDVLEKKHGVTLELLRFFREIDYPVSFSTKSVWHLKDERYRECFEGAKNFHVKVSIITFDEEKARMVEQGVPTSEERLWSIGEYAKMGIPVNLRLRPFIIGITNPSHIELIRRAKELGAYGLSTEFFCLETRGKHLKKRYRLMSQYCGFDLWEFYRQMSKGAGYLRLNYEVKRPFVLEMENLCKEIGMKFFVSDANHKERCAHGSCCGLPEESPYFNNFAKCQFTHAIVLAREKGEVRFSDIAKEEHTYLEKVKSNTTTKKLGLVSSAKHLKQTNFEYMRTIWNSPKYGKSPYKYFDKILIPTGIDQKGDVVYKFNQKKYEGGNS